MADWTDEKCTLYNTHFTKHTLIQCCWSINRAALIFHRRTDIGRRAILEEGFSILRVPPLYVQSARACERIVYMRTRCVVVSQSLRELSPMES